MTKLIHHRNCFNKGRTASASCSWNDSHLDPLSAVE
jgi:hypothetical protein